MRSVEGEPTENCPFGENSAKALEIMLNKCEEFGFPVENVENEENQTIEIDPVAEEYNRSKLLSFLKVRHKSDVVGFKIINVVCMMVLIWN